MSHKDDVTIINEVIKTALPITVTARIMEPVIAIRSIMVTEEWLKPLPKLKFYQNNGSRKRVKSNGNKDNYVSRAA